MSQRRQYGHVAALVPLPLREQYLLRPEDAQILTPAPRSGRGS
jgi:hypothetical protein